MPQSLSPSAQKVQDALLAFGLDLQVLELPSSTRTAVEAAQAVGCDVGQIVKSLVFGLTIILVACYKGYYTQHGAAGVSKATNQTVVLSAVLILAWDYVLTSFFM